MELAAELEQTLFESYDVAPQLALPYDATPSQGLFKVWLNHPSTNKHHDLHLLWYHSQYCTTVWYSTVAVDQKRSMSMQFHKNCGVTKVFLF
jgi:hypothetical protein